MYWIICWVIAALMKTVTRIHIEGVDNYPPEGSMILAVNHLSRLDPPLITVALRRRLRIFAADKYRKNPFIFLLFQAVGVIWVRQSDADLDALRDALAHLRSGGALGVAPEGTRSRHSNAMIRAKSGIAYLVSRSGAAVLPVAVWGTENIIPSLLRLRRAEAWLRIGKPLHLNLSPRAKGEELEAGADEIMCAIAAMLPETYRGEYAGHPRLIDRLSKGPQ